MDINGFKRLTAAVQWAVDQHNGVRRAPGSLRHYQNTYGMASVKKVSEDHDILDDDVRYITVKCPSSACLAGDIVLNAGDEFIVTEATLKQSVLMGWPNLTVERCTDGVESWWIARRASELLGVMYEETDDLFDGEIDINDIVERATDLALAHGFELVLDREVEG